MISIPAKRGLLWLASQVEPAKMVPPIINLQNSVYSISEVMVYLYNVDKKSTNVFDEIEEFFAFSWIKDG